MRLIDANQIEKNLQDKMDGIIKSDFRKKPEKYALIYGLAEALKDIEDAPTIEPCEDAIGIEVAIQTTWMILNGMGYPKEQNKELEQTIKDVFATAPRVLPNHSGEATEMVEDAISREAAIKALIETPREELEFDKGTGVIQELPSVAPSRPSGEWIPCSERLPELGSTVLTFDGNCISVERRIEWIDTPEGQLDGEWWIDGYDGDEYNPINLRDGTAIAWMPLPEPWKGADDDSERD